MIWWWHCFVVTNRGVTSPDPALTSNDKWRFCPTGIKRIKRHVIVLAWLRMQHFGVESWDVGLSSRRFYLSRNTLFSALPHPTPHHWLRTWQGDQSPAMIGCTQASGEYLCWKPEEAVFVWKDKTCESASEDATKELLDGGVATRVSGCVS